MATDAAAGGVAMAARINYRTKMTSLKQAIETEHDNFSTHMKTCFQALGDVLDALHAMRKAPSPPPKQPSTDPQEPTSNKNKNKTPLQAIVSSSKTSQPPKHQPPKPKSSPWRPRPSAPNGRLAIRPIFSAFLVAEPQDDPT